ncbi:hypothetical protein ACFYXS_05360 [Streptomyces sp. NPDC002574]|uniref:hypothetical protein n=1 Tax=Streptomyces sp. NPDC002574 TaxID=3364652 RepID=UPI0036CAFEEA
MDSEGDGWSAVFNVKEIAQEKPIVGQYWTEAGPKTAAQIDAQLRCRHQKANS